MVCFFLHSNIAMIIDAIKNTIIQGAAIIEANPVYLQSEYAIIPCLQSISCWSSGIITVIMNWESLNDTKANIMERIIKLRLRRAMILVISTSIGFLFLFINLL